MTCLPGKMQKVRRANRFDDLVSRDLIEEISLVPRAGQVGRRMSANRMKLKTSFQQAGDCMATEKAARPCDQRMPWRRTPRRSLIAVIRT